MKTLNITKEKEKGIKRGGGMAPSAFPEEHHMYIYPTGHMLNRFKVTVVEVHAPTTAVICFLIYK